MKSSRGVTLTALVIYVCVMVIIISIMAMVSSFFFSNMNLIKDQDKYAVEFNKFNMFFISDVKENKTAQVEANKIVFPNNITYEYRQEEKAVYRNDVKIAEQIQIFEVSYDTTLKINNTTKNLIKVRMNIGKGNNFEKEIEYVLKYW